MDGVGRVYDAGLGYAKDHYLPTENRSWTMIIVTTLVTFLLLRVLLRIEVFRWIYWGTILAIGLTLFYGGNSNPSTPLA